MEVQIIADSRLGYDPVQDEYVLNRIRTLKNFVSALITYG